MAPIDYIKARKEGVADIQIDGRPYLPTTFVDAEDHDTVKRVVIVAIIRLANEPQVDLMKASLTVTKITGGNTNTLFRVSGLHDLIKAESVKIENDKAIPNDALVRLFGAEGMIDRDIENATFAALSRAGHAPMYYGRFGNGRIEGWCAFPMKALEVHDFRDPTVSDAIAASTGRFHSHFDVPQDLKEYHDTSKPSMWTQLHSWLDQALASTFQTDHDTARAERLNIPQLQDEIKWLEKDVVPSDAKAGFCHNDLLAANVLWDSESKVVQLIDFEYGGANYYSFDIANHFNEFAGGTESHATPHYEWLPDRAFQKRFVEKYLQHASADSDRPVSEEDVERLLSEVDGFLLANHLYWGLWAINQAAIEGCDNNFDYLKYGTARIEQYYVQKATNCVNGGNDASHS